MKSFAPTQVHHTVGNDLGGTQRPSGELGWGGLSSSDAGHSRRANPTFQQLNPLMGVTVTIEHQKLGGAIAHDRNSATITDQGQRTGTTARQVGGLEIASDPVLSKDIGDVVFNHLIEVGGLRLVNAYWGR